MDVRGLEQRRSLARETCPLPVPCRPRVVGVQRGDRQRAQLVTRQTVHQRRAAVRLDDPTVGPDQENGVARLVHHRAQTAEHAQSVALDGLAPGVSDPGGQGQDHDAAPQGQGPDLAQLAAVVGVDLRQVDLDHQHPEDLLAIAYRGAKVVAAFAGRGAEPEEAPQPALHGLPEVRAKGEVAADEAVLGIPVGGRQGHAAGIHQIDDVGAGAPLQLLEQAVGLVLHRRYLGVLQRRTQLGQVAENARQHFVAVQRAEQVGDVEVEGLPVLFGQLVAVIALGQLLQRPEQRREQQCQEQEVAPAWAAR